MGRCLPSLQFKMDGSIPQGGLHRVDTPEEKMLPIIEDAKGQHAASFEGIRVLWEGKLI
jgi:hypothetical protein